MARTYPNRDLHMLLFLKNLIDIPVKGWLVLLIDEVLHPFYAFQLFGVAVWMAAKYYVSMHQSCNITPLIVLCGCCICNI